MDISLFLEVQAVPQAASILVVGPGLGEELVPLLTALPQSSFTLLEPSAQMRAACTREIDAAGAAARCELIARSVEPGVDPPGGPFDTVVSHNVLHLMPPERQMALLQTLATCVSPGGALVLSAYSEPENVSGFEALLSIARTRLRQRGHPEAMSAAAIPVQPSLAQPSSGMTRCRSANSLFSP